MTTEEQDAIKIAEKENGHFTENGAPISVAHLKEAITALIPTDSKHKITVSANEDEFFCASLRMLAAFVKLLLNEKYFAPSDSIILKSDKILFTVEIKKSCAFPECEELIKCANLAGFSAKNGKGEICFSAPIANEIWTSLYTKTQNPLLSLLKSNAF